MTSSPLLSLTFIPLFAEIETLVVQDKFLRYIQFLGTLFLGFSCFSGYHIGTPKYDTAKKQEPL